ncbi:1,4-dihydroxy-2-naphthoyl-CoA hydrolase [Rhodococcus sp. LBL1]|uniref:1,4-dihydroxy-2-naphthoyl-CoA hydrolase n=1 Tax=Prescottella agglutinans TaxID=1644129 RepID=A0ABT6M5T0_9NOCA|nr:hotdog fold thioesterase [Prescottella agglutinans]MDH6279239.1 1,4-dihydroxy-2-naphthoyl-CoA hydrolase [Prescottella agglutinans]MDH6677892.1 1,4-dihydroxy-2-naphthoyl-CoA hydrolase [Rhodococcus sp. LBL1]MDH6683479.1 1,4-dihydroxy-2-naphthoyl-CoA hydrolase [Rhodococcus sp. LBL2]
MSIWIGDPTIEIANEKGTDTLNANLGIEITEMTENSLKGRMPVDERTKQPAGVLHGGASVAFAETLASWAAISAVDRSRFHCVGMEINANHVRPVSSGWVYGEATPLALGRRTHVWEIKIVNDEGKLVCVARCTMAVLETPSQY